MASVTTRARLDCPGAQRSRAGKDSRPAVSTQGCLHVGRKDTEPYSANVKHWTACAELCSYFVWVRSLILTTPHLCCSATCTLLSLAIKGLKSRLHFKAIHGALLGYLSA